MSRAVIQKGTHLQYEHFGPAAAPLSFNVDIARAIFNFGSRGSLPDNTRWRKEPDQICPAITLDDFLLDDLVEFSSEEIAAPISNKDTKLPKFEPCESLSTLSNDNFCFQPHGPETKPNDEATLNSFKDTIPPPLCNDMEPVLEWFSPFDDETDSLHGVSNFEENALLSISNDQLFSPATAITVGKNDLYSSPSNRENSTGCNHEERSSLSPDAKDMHTKDVSFPGRARSKRSRSGARVWSSGVLTKGSNSRNGSTGLASAFSDSSVISLESAGAYPDDGEEEFVEVGLDSRKEWKASRKSKKGQDNGQAKRCAHCLSQKTPQWRAGPTGPKTLCNACGVRYKSSRLFPEYRPAKSPTFLSHVHSNSHRKVLELRRERLAPTGTSPQSDGELIFKPHCLDLDQYRIFVSGYVGLNRND